MLMLPMLVAAVVACDNGTASRAPYEGVPEGTPPNLGSTVPDPKEQVATLPAGEMPDYVKTADAVVQTLYKGAVDQFDAYSHIPCYCGCAIYTTAHKNLAECFIKEKKADGTLVFTDHSLTCSQCQQGAQMTLDGLAQGTPLKDVRQAIFDELSYTGIWTDTPPVP
jgi:Protein of unknown function with PCYCGC motif